MTIEELQAQVAELKTEKEAMSKKNTELLSEVKKLKAKNSDAVEAEKYAELESKYDELKAEYDKLGKTYKVDTQKLNEQLQTANNSLNKHLIDANLSDNLAKIGVKPEFLEATKALLRGSAALKDESGEMKAYIGDKPLSEYVKEWSEKDGKAFIASGQGQGGGASGGGGNAAASGDFGGTHEQRQAAIKAKFNL
ncbi:MAG: guided entry of tail-anchored proteins factor 1 [Campylobacter sp.]|nr:guided entry of tail-anchored proteins factor 1 [Campylobacter sp.]